MTFGLQTETRNLSSLAVTADLGIQLRVISYGQDENDSTNKEVEGLPLPAFLIDLYSLDKRTFFGLTGASGERKELERRATLLDPIRSAGLL